MYWVTRDAQGRWIHLHEGTAAEFRADGRGPLKISGREAHRIVKGDLIPHSTALWVHEGRIRRAQEGF